MENKNIIEIKKVFYPSDNWEAETITCDLHDVVSCVPTRWKRQYLSTDGSFEWRYEEPN